MYLLWNTFGDRLGERIKSAFTGPACSHFSFKLQPQPTSLALSFTSHMDAHTSIALPLLFPALPSSDHTGPLSSLRMLVCLSHSSVFTECRLFPDCLFNLPLPPLEQVCTQLSVSLLNVISSWIHSWDKSAACLGSSLSPACVSSHLGVTCQQKP